ncbi:hypothetical protein Tco_0588073 [Tanacetum coccineum]
MLSLQKPSGDKLGIGFNSFEASTSRTKKTEFVKSQNETPSGGDPLIAGGGPQIAGGSPLSAQMAPKAIQGPRACSTENGKSVSFQKSILGPKPKHIMVNKVKIPIASDDEVERFYKPALKPEVGFSKPDFREITKDRKIIDKGICKRGLYVMKLGKKPEDKICLAMIDETQLCSIGD